MYVQPLTTSINIGGGVTFVEYILHLECTNVACYQDFQAQGIPGPGLWTGSFNSNSCRKKRICLRRDNPNSGCWEEAPCGPTAPDNGDQPA